jgi:AraC family transcriptional regulator, transcriptional activator of pobA
MAAPTPVLSIETLTESPVSVAYFSPERTLANSSPLNQPYRSTYYGIGLCTAGTAQLMADLHDYEVGPGSLISISPTVIKQWKFRSNDYDSLTIFFRADFVSDHQTQHTLLDTFVSPGQSANYVITLENTDYEAIRHRLIDVRAFMQTPSQFQPEKVRHLIWALLYEVAELQQQNTPNTPLTRRQLLTNTFRSLINQHVTRERMVRYYADQMAITPKHLTETIKETTGKTAGAWIDEALLLEARILLQNPALTIAQVADQLSFPDASVFGKFFRKQSGQSPGAYRQSLT